MRERLRLVIRGAVQGVGFRPFIYRMANELELDGWVVNSPQGVCLEVEGPPDRLEACLLRVERDRPPRAVIQSLEPSWLDPVPYAGFEIRESSHAGPATALLLPDIAMCAECRAEIFDPANRRHAYPFTNCTNCGPRFTIITGLPYDRARTTMRGFAMCPACLAEYHDPADRRFHAQPNACPACGPQLALWDSGGRTLSACTEASFAAAAAIRAGRIVAVKGLGGFHLMADATNADAVARLRSRKHREEKPFALMYPSLADAERDCEVSLVEARLLTSAEAPIVLLARRPHADRYLAAGVAPRNPALGVMLPYTPLHALLLESVGRPVVATSGNLSDEPICTDEREALERLKDVADLWLVHDRPIVRHADDSITRVMLGRELILRRARGYAPLPIAVPGDEPSILAVGAHLKNTVAVTVGSNAFVSQHIGDLESQRATEAFVATIDGFEQLFGLTPSVIATDLHPGYLSTQYAASLGRPVVGVQHHHAHVAACMADNQIDGPVLGVSWDGTGYGPDGTIWGGEFLLTAGASCRRVASLRPFRLPGGEQAIREPRRSALGVLHAIGASAAVVDTLELAPADRAVLLRMLDRGLNAPVTTSAGRLCDAVAALLGLCRRSTFEGQAAMALEAAADPDIRGPYAFALDEDPGRFAFGEWMTPDVVVDWEPTIRELFEDVSQGSPAPVVSARFHRTLVEAIVAVAARVGERRVVLTGGCFQNRLLTEWSVLRLRQAGFAPYWHQRIPPNDGGIALGQIAVARARAMASARADRDEATVLGVTANP
jgi:hydrogenase maturation protein HypF